MIRSAARGCIREPAAPFEPLRTQYVKIAGEVCPHIDKEPNMSARGSQSRIDRRRFLRSAAGAGAALALGPVALAQPPAPAPSDQINVALIGAGNQGKVLTEAARRIEGVRFRAVCDIWSFNRKWASRRLKAYGQPGRRSRPQAALPTRRIHGLIPISRTCNASSPPRSRSRRSPGPAEIRPDRPARSSPNRCRRSR